MPLCCKDLPGMEYMLSPTDAVRWRNLIAYAWVIRYKGFPETLSLFRKMHWIKEDGSTKGKGGGKRRRSRAKEDQGRGGWMSLYTEGGKLKVYPKLTSLKHWRERFFWVGVPAEFPLRCQWTKPRPRMEHIPDRGLSGREKQAFDFFTATSIHPLKGKRGY